MTYRNNQLYPIELSLHRIKKSWGGWPGKIGEIWSLSCDPYESLALNGFLAGQRLREIVGEFQQRLLGKDIELDPKEPFPLLLRFISTSENLPVQVHPDDNYAFEEGLAMVGRDKIIYIVSANPKALIYTGFRDPSNKKIVEDSVKNGSIRELMNQIPVKPGDVYTIPAGRIHSIGKGISLLEIQRHSRLNFNLSDSKKNSIKTENHVNQLTEALKILDFNPLHPCGISKFEASSNDNRIEWLGITPRFLLRKLCIKNSLDLTLPGNRFLVYTGIKGKGWLRWGLSNISVFIQPGQSILVPALPEDILFESGDGLEIMETSIPDLSGETIRHISELGISHEKIAALGGDDYGKIIRECMC